MTASASACTSEHLFGMGFSMALPAPLYGSMFAWVTPGTQQGRMLGPTLVQDLIDLPVTQGAYHI